MKSVFRTTILCIVMFLLSSNYLYALPDAKEIYRQACENQETLSYMAEATREESGSPIHDIYVQFIDSDGTKFSRRELTRVHSGQKKVSDDLTVISNRDGLFHITPTQIMKLKFQLGRKPLNTEGLDVSYSIKEGRCNKSSCWIVTRDFSMDDKTFKSYVQSLPDDLKKNATRESFEENFSPKDVTYIDKKLLLPIKTENYGRDGQKMSERNWGMITLNPQIDMDWFKIDANRDINVAKKFNTYSQASHDEVKNDLPQNAMRESSPFVSRIIAIVFDFLQRLLYSPWTAKILLLIGVACVALLILIKWKQK